MSCCQKKSMLTNSKSTNLPKDWHKKTKSGTIVENTSYNNLSYLENELTQAAFKFEKTKEFIFKIVKKTKMHEVEGQKELEAKLVQLKIAYETQIKTVKQIWADMADAHKEEARQAESNINTSRIVFEEQQAGIKAAQEAIKAATQATGPSYVPAAVQLKEQSNLDAVARFAEMRSPEAMAEALRSKANHEISNETIAEVVRVLAVNAAEATAHHKKFQAEAMAQLQKDHELELVMIREQRERERKENLNMPPPALTKAPPPGMAGMSSSATSIISGAAGVSPDIKAPAGPPPGKPKASGGPPETPKVAAIPKAVTGVKKDPKKGKAKKGPKTDEVVSDDENPLQIDFTTGAE